MDKGKWTAPDGPSRTDGQDSVREEEPASPREDTTGRIDGASEVEKTDPATYQVRSPDPYTGSIIGRKYRVENLIAMGATGRVYRATQEPMGRAVAVKILRKDVKDDGHSNFKERFLREASLAGALSHPNIITIHDYGEIADGSCYIVMEYLKGRPLKQVLTEGPMPAGRAIPLFEQLARGLRHAHRAGVIHRDIKPGNIWVGPGEDGSDLLTILDFGLVKAVDDPGLTVDGTFMGTPSHSSPEQCSGLNTDSRSDIYSSGVLMYQVLTGVLPFEGSTHLAVALCHLNEPYPAMVDRAPSARVPAELEAVVRRCMEKDPSNRYPDCDTLLFDLKYVHRVLFPAQAPPTGESSASTPVNSTLMPAEMEGGWLDDPPAAEGADRATARGRSAALLSILVAAAMLTFLIGRALWMEAMAPATPSFALQPTGMAPGPVAALEPAVVEPATIPIAEPTGAAEPSAVVEPAVAVAEPIAVAEAEPPKPKVATPVSKPPASKPEAVASVAPAAPTAVAAEVVQPPPTVVAPPAAAKPESVAPDSSALSGTWSGKASGRPITFAWKVAPGGTISGTVEMRVGAEAVRHAVSGKATVTAAGWKVELKETDSPKPFTYQGTVTASGGSGTLFLDGKDRGTWSIAR